MLLNQQLEEGYQRYQTELELAHGQRINGRRHLADGKVEVLCDHSCLHYLYAIFSVLLSKMLSKWFDASK